MAPPRADPSQGRALATRKMPVAQDRRCIVRIPCGRHIKRQHRDKEKPPREDHAGVFDLKLRSAYSAASGAAFGARGLRGRGVRLGAASVTTASACGADLLRLGARKAGCSFSAKP